MQEVINELLDNAWDNEYDQRDVAIDLVACSAEIENAPIEVLIPYIKVWQDAK
jgi:hypothetical protein